MARVLVNRPSIAIATLAITLLGVTSCGPSEDGKFRRAIVPTLQQVIAVSQALDRIDGDTDEAIATGTGRVAEQVEALETTLKSLPVPRARELKYVLAQCQQVPQAALDLAKATAAERRATNEMFNKPISREAFEELKPWQKELVANLSNYHAIISRIRASEIRYLHSATLQDYYIAEMQATDRRLESRRRAHPEWNQAPIAQAPLEERMAQWQASMDSVLDAELAAYK